MKNISLVIVLLLAPIGVRAADDGNVSVRLFEAQQSIAEQGGPQAQFYLGEMYEQGLGTERNMNQAIIWYTRAANQGYRLAQRKLKDLANTEKPTVVAPARTKKPERTVAEPPAETTQADETAKRAKEQAEAEQARKAAEVQAQELATQRAAKLGTEAAAKRLRLQQEAEAMRKAKLELDALEKEKRRAAAKAAVERGKRRAEKARAY